MTADRRPPLGGHLHPLLQDLPAGRGACRFCGVMLPVDTEVERRVVHQMPAVAHVTGYDPEGKPIHAYTSGEVFYATLGEHPDCRAHFEPWAAAYEPAWVYGERLGVAAYLLRYDGQPGADVLTAAGLTHPQLAELPVLRGLKFEDWITEPLTQTRPWDRSSLSETRMVQNRAASAATMPWSHLAKSDINPLRVLCDDTRAAAANAGRPLIWRAEDAAPSLFQMHPHSAALPDQYRVADGCGACGVAAVQTTWGTPAGDVWTVAVADASMVVLPAHLRHRVTDRSDKAVGLGHRVAVLLCPACNLADGELAFGDDLAEALFERLLEGQWFPPLALASRLWASKVLAGRFAGWARTVFPSENPWAHMPRNAAGDDYRPIVGTGEPRAITTSRDPLPKPVDPRPAVRKEVLEALAPTLNKYLEVVQEDAFEEGKQARNEANRTRIQQLEKQVSELLWARGV